MAAFASALTSKLPDINVRNGDGGPFVAWHLTADERARFGSLPKDLRGLS